MFGVGNISMVPQTPQLPQLPFGLSSITDFIYLTEPTPIIAQPVPRHPTPNQNQQQRSRSFKTEQQQYQPSSKSNPNIETYSRPQRNQHTIYRPSTNYVQESVPVPVSTAPYFNPNYSSPPHSQYPYTSVTPLSSSHSQSGTSTLPTTSFGTSMPPQEPQKQHFFTSTPSPFTPIYKPESSSTSSSGSLAPPPPTIEIPQTSTETFNDPTRRSVPSPTTSGVQIDLINLRQKLSRDIQNNMKVVTEQHSKIKELENRADGMQTGYSHLKCDLEDLKRKKKEQDGKLKEIDSLLKSALTMSSFSSPTALQVEMFEDDDGMNAMLLVAAVGE